jgi:hypothetical protein
MPQPKGSLSMAVLWLALPALAFAAPAVESRSVEPFSKLRIENGIDVTLNAAARESLLVTADGYALNDIVTEVIGDELRISVAPGARRPLFGVSREARVAVDFVSLTRIEASGGSDVTGRGELRAEELTVSASGGSDIDLATVGQRLELAASGGSDANLRGKVYSLVVTASGGSDVAASALETRDATVQVSGGSDASLTVTEKLTLNASGGSDVRIAGNPSQRDVRSDRSSDIRWR